MDISSMFELVSTIPIWVWIAGAIAILILFGDRGLWEYEVKFPFSENAGRGEVEFKCYKKKGSVIEVELNLESECINKDIDIYLNNHLVYSIPGEKNNSARLYLNRPLDMQKPNEGDEVSVKVQGRNIFNGPLVLD